MYHACFLVFQYPVGENMFQSLFYPLQTKFLDTVNTLCGRVPQVFLKQVEKTMKVTFEQKVLRHARPLNRQRRWTATDYQWPGGELILQNQCFFLFLVVLFFFLFFYGTCAIPRTQCGFLTSVLCRKRMMQSFLDRLGFQQWSLWNKRQLDKGSVLEQQKKKRKKQSIRLIPRKVLGM